jgi:hypothetical protein
MCCCLIRRAPRDLGQQTGSNLNVTIYVFLPKRPVKRTVLVTDALTAQSGSVTAPPKGVLRS